LNKLKTIEKMRILEYILSPETTIVSLLCTLILLCVLLLCVPKENTFLYRSISLCLSFIPLLWSIWLCILYDSSGQVYQCVCNVYILTFGIDSVGLLLVVLTTAIMPICILLMRTVSGIYLFILLECCILGSLLVLDLLGFYILFESSLILLFISLYRLPTIENLNIIKLYNKNSKSYSYSFTTLDAAYKIVIYTMAGSILFLPVIGLLYNNYGTTSLLLLIGNNISQYEYDTNIIENISEYEYDTNKIENISEYEINKSNQNHQNHQNLHLLLRSSNSEYKPLSIDVQLIYGWGLLAIFAVKIPLIPVHLWLPEAHVSASTSGSILLAGVLLKLGTLGCIRYLIPLFPVFVIQILPLIISLCLISFLYSTTTLLRQIDCKKIVAYSSIAHMSLITLTIFTISNHSVLSSTFMMIAHGCISPGLFLLVGILYKRTGTKYLPYFAGIGTYMPIYNILFFLCICAFLSFPLFPSFIAELGCLFSLFSLHSLYAYIFCICQVLGAIYAFWMYNRLFHGVFSYNFISLNHNITSTSLNTLNHNNNITSQLPTVTPALQLYSTCYDITRQEFACFCPLLIGIVWLGLKPFA